MIRFTYSVHAVDAAVAGPDFKHAVIDMVKWEIFKGIVADKHIALTMEQPIATHVITFTGLFTLDDQLRQAKVLLAQALPSVRTGVDDNGRPGFWNSEAHKLALQIEEFIKP